MPASGLHFTDRLSTYLIGGYSLISHSPHNTTLVIDQQSLDGKLHMIPYEAHFLAVMAVKIFLQDIIQFDLCWLPEEEEAGMNVCGGFAREDEWWVIYISLEKVPKYRNMRSVPRSDGETHPGEE
jgi:hypothetical protein